ncbi:unnamed protein product [Rotaria sp. Silwood2]|nr:unnamed protein product [Rotaria sp. Silwood2]
MKSTINKFILDHYRISFVVPRNALEVYYGDEPFILRAVLTEVCSNVFDLTILTALLISSKFIDNPSLIPVFKQIKVIETILEDVYFPSNFASKFVERFPSLIQIELQVISFNNCVSIIDTFLSRLKNLAYLKIDYFEDSSLDDPFSRENIIEKRRQAFPTNTINEQAISVKNDGEVVEIWLI